MQKKVEIENNKGLMLSAIIETPGENEEYPGVIIFHGFKGYKEEESYTDLAEKLVEKGIASIRFDASGSGESEGTFEDDYRFSNYENDAEVIYEYFKKLSYIDENKLSAMGQSMGGMLAIVFSSKHPELRSVAILQAPDILGAEDLLGKELKEWEEKGYLRLVSSKMGDIKIPYEFYLDIKQFDMKEFISEVKIPKLFIVGEKDETVPLVMTRRIYESAPKPKEWVVFKDVDHFYKREPNKLDMVNKKILQFLKKYLKN